MSHDPRQKASAGSSGECTLSPNADLQTVLAAWHDATLRLEETHAALQAEVRRLTEELQAKNRELARRNRLADLGQFATHIAHELRNNLVPVTLYLSLLRRRLDDTGAANLIDKIESGCLALDTTVNDLLHFASDREPIMQTVTLSEIVDDVLSSLSPQFQAQGIRVDVDVPPVALPADRTMLRRALVNLVLNAVDAMPTGGDLVITGVESSRHVDLEIADSGPGLSDEARHRAFEPFYTTKSNGTGLGLAIVERVALAHGGAVVSQNCPEGGAAFTLRFPRRMVMGAAA